MKLSTVIALAVLISVALSIGVNYIALREHIKKTQ
jgi:hypothetical protein